MKQVAVVERIDEGKNWVSRRLTGPTPILADEVPRFAEALHVPMAVLYDDRELERFLRGDAPPAEKAERVARGSIPVRPDTYAPATNLYPVRDSLRDVGIDDEAADALTHLADVIARRSAGR